MADTCRMVSKRTTGRVGFCRVLLARRAGLACLLQTGYPHFAPGMVKYP